MGDVLCIFMLCEGYLVLMVFPVTFCNNDSHLYIVHNDSHLYIVYIYIVFFLYGYSSYLNQLVAG